MEKGTDDILQAYVQAAYTMKPFVRNIIPMLVLGVLVVYAGYPLLRPGFLPTHDGEYHIIRFMEFFRMLSQGHLFPRWAPGFNHGYGIPLFIFHYPLPNYFGSFFQWLGMSFADAFKMTVFLGYAVFSIFTYLLLKRFWGILPALTGAAAAMTVPYFFVQIYVRGSVGEVLALAAFAAAAYGLFAGRGFMTAICFFLLILSHNISAMLMAPFLILASIVYWRKGLVYLVSGALMASYFWLPAIGERQYVVGLNTVRFSDHFAQPYELLIPSWGTGFSAGGIEGKMSLQLGIVPMLLLAGSFLAALKDSHSRRKWMIFSVLGVVLIASFMMLPVSLFLWRVMPLLPFVQHPWRFLIWMIPVTAVLGAYVTLRMGKRSLSVALIIMILSVLASNRYIRPVMYDPRPDAYFLARPDLLYGTSSMGNAFSTVWSSWKQEPASESVTVVRGDAVIEALSSDRLLMLDIAVNAREDSILDANIFYYPGWQVQVDSKDVPVLYDESGTVRFGIPAGRHTVDVRFTETPLRKAANALSLSALCATIAISYAERKGRDKP